MSMQYITAPEGKEYKTTYIGKQYHLDEKMKLDPRLKHRIPKRWITNRWVITVDKDGEL